MGCKFCCTGKDKKLYRFPGFAVRLFPGTRTAFFVGSVMLFGLHFIKCKDKI